VSYRYRGDFGAKLKGYNATTNVTTKRAIKQHSLENNRYINNEKEKIESNTESHGKNLNRILAKKKSEINRNPI
jgi:hypothetical protein